MGCGSIPDIVFVPDEGGTSSDGGLEDARPVDADPGDVVTQDAPPACTIPPGSPPSTKCCGQYACLQSCSDNCDRCSSCTVGQICCKRGNNVTCIAPNESCN